MALESACLCQMAAVMSLIPLSIAAWDFREAIMSCGESEDDAAYGTTRPGSAITESGSVLLAEYQIYDNLEPGSTATSSCMR